MKYITPQDKEIYTKLMQSAFSRTTPDTDLDAALDSADHIESLLERARGADLSQAKVSRLSSK